MGFFDGFVLLRRLMYFLNQIVCKLFDQVILIKKYINRGSFSRLLHFNGSEIFKIKKYSKCFIDIICCEDFITVHYYKP